MSWSWSSLCSRKWKNITKFLQSSENCLKLTQWLRIGTLIGKVVPQSGAASSSLLPPILFCPPMKRKWIRRARGLRWSSEAVLALLLQVNLNVLRYLRSWKLFRTRTTFPVLPTNRLFYFLLYVFSTCLIAEEKRTTQSLGSFAVFFLLSGFRESRMRKSCLLRFLW